MNVSLGLILAEILGCASPEIEAQSTQPVATDSEIPSSCAFIRADEKNNTNTSQMSGACHAKFMTYCGTERTFD